MQRVESWSHGPRLKSNGNRLYHKGNFSPPHTHTFISECRRGSTHVPTKVAVGATGTGEKVFLGLPSRAAGRKDKG